MKQPSCQRKLFSQLYIIVSASETRWPLGIQTCLHLAKLGRQGTQGDSVWKCSSAQYDTHNYSFRRLSRHASTSRICILSHSLSDFSRFDLHSARLLCFPAQIPLQTWNIFTIVCLKL